MTEDELLESTGEDTLEDITDLTLRDRGLTSLPSPELLRRLSNLEVLSFSHNRLSSLSSLTACCDRITHLNVSFNALTSLDGLEACRHLTKLYASNNRVRSLEPLVSCAELQVWSVARGWGVSLQHSSLIHFGKVKHPNKERV